MSSRVESWSRRTVLQGLVTAGLTACARVSIPLRGPAFAADFDDLWSSCRDAYCFFGEKSTVWDQVRSLYRDRAAAATSVDAFADVLDEALAELYDPHCHVQGQRTGARRWIPFDVWAEWRGSRAVVTAVHTDSMASRAGVVPGDEVLALDAVPMAASARAVLPRCLPHEDVEASAFALLQALAGRRGAPRTLQLRSPDGVTREVVLAPGPGAAGADEPAPVRWSVDGAFGYVRIESFGDGAVVGLFDQALQELRDTKGLLLDVRENGGGDTAYARPMMGRFITARTQYAWMARRVGAGLGARWPEFVEPRGPFTYTRPVVVLVDRFSASMAEGFPMGMRAVAGATIVGTRMAGLGAAIRTEQLRRSGLSFQFSAEPVYDVSGNPRARLVPDVPVDLEGQSAGEDRIRTGGLRVLSART